MSVATEPTTEEILEALAPFAIDTGFADHLGLETVRSRLKVSDIIRVRQIIARLTDRPAEQSA